MIEIYLISIIVFILSFVQTIAGVGLLVIGTPVFLIIGYDMIEIMFYLLPLSIITSTTSLLILKQKKRSIHFNNKLFQYFVTICLPSMFVGLVLLNYFSHIFNFKFIVAFIIIVSIFIKIKVSLKNINFDADKIYKKAVIFFIGIVHGLTNSGGTLLSLYLIKNDKKNMIYNIYNIHFFYFILAFVQIILLISIVNENKFIFFDNSIIYSIPLFSSLIASRLITKLNVLTNYLIYFLALVSALTLMII